MKIFKVGSVENQKHSFNGPIVQCYLHILKKKKEKISQNTANKKEITEKVE